MSHSLRTFFAPQLFIPNGVSDISFYEKAFGAVEMQRWNNDDETVHVAEFSIGEVLFHLHEEKPGTGELSPAKAKGVTSLVGIFVSDVDDVFNRAVEAGAIALMPPTTFDYNYRQAEIKDPFGHIWLIEKKL